MYAGLHGTLRRARYSSSGGLIAFPSDDPLLDRLFAPESDDALDASGSVTSRPTLPLTPLGGRHQGNGRFQAQLARHGKAWRYFGPPRLLARAQIPPRGSRCKGKAV